MTRLRVSHHARLSAYLERLLDNPLDLETWAQFTLLLGYTQNNADRSLTAVQWTAFERAGRALSELHIATAVALDRTIKGQTAKKAAPLF